MFNKKTKFQNTNIGVIVLGLTTSAIWSFISSEKDTSISNSFNKNSSTIQNNNIEGDLVKGDKTISNNSLEEEYFSEYVFINNLSVIIAITNKDKKVVAFSITTLSDDFLPEISIENSSFNFILGETKFYEIDEMFGEPVTFGVCGANWFHYSEKYYTGRPGNYQDYIFSMNENGLLGRVGCGFINVNIEFSKEEEINEFRKKFPPNTITITSPFFNEDYNKSKIFDDFVYGPNVIQMNLIEGESKKINALSLENNIKKLYPDSNVKKFIDIFGEPDFINSINTNNSVN